MIKGINMGKIIVPTGYMGSGSSAITDLLTELEGYDADTGTFEYVFLHCPNGLFDLEDKLLKGNNALRSDEALHSFKKTMQQLFDKKYWWVGHYNQKLTPEFLNYTEEYVESLIQYKPEYYWYFQENADIKMVIKLIINKILSIISLGKLTLKKPLVYTDLMLSYVSPEEFYERTKLYLRKIWMDLGINTRNVILDQLLLPFNLFRIDNYFDEEELKVFVIDRDPRDVFFLNKYVWSKQKNPIPYPTNVEEFCKCYKRLRQMERKSTYPGVMRIHFEDLIYHYEETVKKVMEHLGEPPEKHIRKKSCFIPENSIENTQIFLTNELFIPERRKIEEELREYLYEFPYERKANFKKAF